MTPRYEPHGGDPYTIPFAMKVNQQMLKALDRVRGNKSRGEYMRDLLRAELELKEDVVLSHETHSTRITGAVNPNHRHYRDQVVSIVTIKGREIRTFRCRCGHQWQAS